MRRLFGWREAAATVAKRLTSGLAAAAEVDLFALVEGEADRELFAPLMMTVAKRQVVRFSAGTTVIGAGIEGDGDRHTGVGILVAHEFSSFRDEELFP